MFQSKIKKTLAWAITVCTVLMLMSVSALTASAETTVTVYTFSELQEQVEIFGHYLTTGSMTILVGADIEITQGLDVRLNASDGSSLTIKSAPGPTRTIIRRQNFNNHFFQIASHLILENIILDGNKDNPPSSASGYLIRASGTNSFFTMNDGAVIQNSLQDLVCVVSVENAATFTMNGGKITGNGSQAVSLAGVTLGQPKFIMNGGEISGNTNGVRAQTAGVNLSGGIFTMNGGKIIGNHSLSSGGAGGQGGGVYLLGNSEFYMYGGEISGNSANLGGGGVWINSFNSIVEIGGTAKIINNQSNSVSDNLRYPANNTLRLLLGKDEKAPSEGMRVGISNRLDRVVLNNNVFVLSGATENDTQWFFADDPTLMVAHDNGTLRLMEIIPCDTHQPPASFVFPKCHESTKIYNCRNCGTPVTAEPAVHVFGRWVEVLPETDKYPAVKIEMCTNMECDVDSGEFQGRSDKNSNCDFCRVKIDNGWYFLGGTLTIVTNEGTTAWRDGRGRSAATFQIEDVTSVIIGDAVTSIADSAFEDCIALTTVSFRSSTPPTFGNSVFGNTPVLTAINVPGGAGALYKTVPQLSGFNIVESSFVVPPTGIAGVQGTMAAIIFFLLLSAGLWGCIICRRLRGNNIGCVLEIPTSPAE